MDTVLTQVITESDRKSKEKSHEVDIPISQPQNLPNFIDKLFNFLKGSSESVKYTMIEPLFKSNGRSIYSLYLESEESLKFHTFLPQLKKGIKFISIEELGVVVVGGASQMDEVSGV